MKINKTISIDHGLMDKLQGVNASELINTLLIEHFKEDKLEVIKEESENLTIKIEELQEKENKIKADQLKQTVVDSIIIDDKIKEWFIKRDVKPTILELDQYIQAHHIKRVLNMKEYLDIWDKIHNA